MTNCFSKSKGHVVETIHSETKTTRELSGWSSWLRCLHASGNVVKNNKMVLPLLRYGFLTNWIKNRTDYKCRNVFLS
jgi:hypothetical protein